MSTDIVFPDEVRGWLTQDEGDLLVKAARGRVGLEVGTFCGRSTLLLGQVCSLLITVDTHRGDRNIGIQDSLTEFLIGFERFERRGLLNRVVPVIGRIEDVGPLLAPASFSFIYIDAEHYEDTAEASVRAIEHCASPDCIWAFHDHGLGDVQRVALRLATRRHMDMEVHHTTYGLALLRPHLPAARPE
jgi:MMP 1-O-methyltransferase